MAIIGGIFNNQFTANLPRNLPVKKMKNRYRFDRIMAMSLWTHCLAHPVDRSMQQSNKLTFLLVRDQ